MSFTSPGMIRPSDATRLTLYPRHIIKAGEDNMGLIASSDWHPLIISFLGSGLHGPPCSLRHDSLLGWWFLTEISWIGFPAVTTIRRKLRQKKTMRTGGKKDSHYIYPSKSFFPRRDWGRSDYDGEKWLIIGLGFYCLLSLQILIQFLHIIIIFLRVIVVREVRLIFWSLEFPSGSVSVRSPRLAA